MVSEPPRPSVVTSCDRCDTPWKPATSTILPVVERRRGCGRPCTSMMFALVCDVSVTMPACEPVSEIASWPRSLMTIAASAQEMRSPVESSMSISRGCGRGRRPRRRARPARRCACRARTATATTSAARPPCAATIRARGALDALGVGDRGAAELHDDGVCHRARAWTRQHSVRALRRLTGAGVRLASRCSWSLALARGRGGRDGGRGSRRRRQTATDVPPPEARQGRAAHARLVPRADPAAAPAGRSEPRGPRCPAQRRSTWRGACRSSARSRSCSCSASAAPIPPRSSGGCGGSTSAGS